MRHLFKGQTVTIYSDPLAEKKPEGEAVLLKKNYSDPHSFRPRCETWLVQFVTDKSQIARAIKVED